MSRVFSKLKRQLKKSVKTPFADRKKRKLIIHCGHHKAGSTWLKEVLLSVSQEYGLTYQKGTQNELRINTDIFIQDHSLIEISKFPPFKGSHMIRDPRDMIISGYFYHLWTKERFVHIPMKEFRSREEWIHVPTEQFGNLTYQQYLSSLDQEGGILAELKRAAGYDIKHMIEWNYNNLDFIEIKYEDLIYNSEPVFYKIFKYYGFSESAIDVALKFVDRFSFKNVAKRPVGKIKLKSHLRSGRPGEWKEFFSEKHKKCFKELLGDGVVKLGYEANNDW